MHGHQHQADGTVGTDVGLQARREALLDHVEVDRIQDQHRIAIHPQRRGRVDEVAGEACLTQRPDHVGRVRAALA
jgi:hypothetical protein